MSQPFDQISESSPMVPAPHTPVSKTTPWLHCAISNSGSNALDSVELSHPMSCRSSAILIHCDNRNTNPVAFDNDQGSIDHITSLERTVCSNFYCCGFQLPDFHALLEHFEESHVVVLAPNGKRVYPREGLQAVPLHPVSSGSSTPDSSRASSTTPSSPTPSLSSPSSPLNVLSPTPSPLSSRKSSFSVPSVYTPFTPTLPIDPAYPFPDTSEVVIAQEHDIDFDIQSTHVYRPGTPEIAPESGSSEDEDMSDSFSSSTDDGSTNLPENAMSNQFLSPEEVSALMVRAKQRFARLGVNEKRKLETPKVASSKSSKSKRYPGPGNSHSKRREKMYRCPKEGCIKIYLNPNGLKYHLERGTCKFADEVDPPNDCSHLRPLCPTPCKQFAASSVSAPFMDAAFLPPTTSQHNRQLPNLSPLATSVKITPPNSDSGSGIGIEPTSSSSPEGTAQLHSRNHIHETVAAIISDKDDGPHEQERSVPEQHVELSRQPTSDPEPTGGSPSPHLRPHLHCQISRITQSLPQQSQERHYYHYPVPTYPLGYLYSQDNRPTSVVLRR